MTVIFYLWVFYVAGYAIAYPLRMWADKKRGEPFEDPELLAQKKVMIPAIIWLVGGFVVSLFVPVILNWTFYIGFLGALIGLIIVVLAFYSFAQGPGLNTATIHRYSRNPNYIGWILFIGSLALIGWSDSVWSLFFFLYFLLTIAYLHWTILIEEDFLASKYGEAYQNYLDSTPRYIGLPKKRMKK